MSDNMTKHAKEYMNAVIETLQRKYNMTEIEAYDNIESFIFSEGSIYNGLEFKDY